MDFERAVGTSVFGGMLAASLVGVFLIPGLYVLQSLRERIRGEEEAGAPSHAEEERSSLHE